jgi:hypothetical protein
MRGLPAPVLSRRPQRPLPERTTIRRLTLLAPEPGFSVIGSRGSCLRGGAACRSTSAPIEIDSLPLHPAACPSSVRRAR